MSAVVALHHMSPNVVLLRTCKWLCLGRRTWTNLHAEQSHSAVQMRYQGAVNALSAQAHLTKREVVHCVRDVRGCHVQSLLL